MIRNLLVSSEMDRLPFKDGGDESDMLEGMRATRLAFKGKWYRDFGKNWARCCSGTGHYWSEQIPTRPLMIFPDSEKTIRDTLVEILQFCMNEWDDLEMSRYNYSYKKQIWWEEIPEEESSDAYEDDPDEIPERKKSSHYGLLPSPNDRLSEKPSISCKTHMRRL